MDTPIHSAHGSNADLPDAAVWRKSSYSGTAGNCVEVATRPPGLVAVRDSKDPEGPMLVIGRAAWSGLIRSIKSGAVS
jgi:hypothetical protein